MSSILVFENEPTQCSKCKIYLRAAGVCPWFMSFPDGECPLKHIHSVDNEITPLSKIKYKKYIVWENDRDELPGGKYYDDIKKLNIPQLGHPRFEYGDVVQFSIKYDKDKDAQVVEGIVFIVDAYGTFEQNEEPSYDIYSVEQNMLFKHIRETGVTLVRKPTTDELEMLKKL